MLWLNICIPVLLHIGLYIVRLSNVSASLLPSLNHIINNCKTKRENMRNLSNIYPWEILLLL